MPTIRLQLDIPGLSSGDALEFYGPTLQADIRRHDFGSPAAAGSDASPPQAMMYPAHPYLSARESGIDSTLAVELGLAVEDTERQASGILGMGAVNVYPARISIFELGLSVVGSFVGVRLAVGGQPYRALIGRDILKNFMMVYDGRTGIVTLSDD